MLNSPLLTNGAENCSHYRSDWFKKADFYEIGLKFTENHNFLDIATHYGLLKNVKIRTISY